MIDVVKMTRTCGACPAQWDGETSDGRSVYVHYRYGSLLVEVAGDEIINKLVGEPGNGVLSYDELQEACAGVLTFPEFEGGS